MFDLDDFIRKRPYLYHLTAAANLAGLIREGTIYSTHVLVQKSNLVEKTNFLSERRPVSIDIPINSSVVKIRDQAPLSIKLLRGCLENGMAPAQYIQLLNGLVFTWPDAGRLMRHFQTYVNEGPIILKFDTAELFLKNQHALFSRLNSGATRSHSRLQGNAPIRGVSTFRPPDRFEGTVSKVAEVVFRNQCILTPRFWTANHPDGPWEEKVV